MAAATANGAGVNAAPTPRATSTAADVAASVRSRRVQASALVRPRSVRPRGPTTPTAPVTAARGQRPIAPIAAATPSAPSAIEPLDDVHHRTAKRVTAPGR